MITYINSTHKNTNMEINLREEGWNKELAEAREFIEKTRVYRGYGKVEEIYRRMEGIVDPLVGEGEIEVTEGRKIPVKEAVEKIDGREYVGFKTKINGTEVFLGRCMEEEVKQHPEYEENPVGKLKKRVEYALKVGNKVGKVYIELEFSAEDKDGNYRTHNSAVWDGKERKVNKRNELNRAVYDLTWEMRDGNAVKLKLEVGIDGREAFRELMRLKKEAMGSYA